MLAVEQLTAALSANATGHASRLFRYVHVAREHQRDFKPFLTCEITESIARQFSNLSDTCRSIAHKVLMTISRCRGDGLAARSAAMFDVLVVGGGPAGLECRADARPLPPPRARLRSRPAAQPASPHALHGYLTRDGIAPPSSTSSDAASCAPYGVELATRRRHRRAHGSTITTASRSATVRRKSARYLLIATGVVDDLPGDPRLRRLLRPLDLSLSVLRRLGVARSAHRRVRHVARRRRPGARPEDVERRRRRVHARRHGSSAAAARAARAATASRSAPSRSRSSSTTTARLTAIAFASGDPLPRDAMFFTTGQHPQSDLAITLGCTLTRRGTVKTGTLCDTNVPRVFVAGDASRDAQFVVVAAAEGVKAAVRDQQGAAGGGAEIVTLKAVDPRPPAAGGRRQRSAAARAGAARVAAACRSTSAARR